MGYTGMTGPKGDPGPQGAQGPAGVCSCSCYETTKLIQADYKMSSDDFYIGVKSDSKVTITLPTEIKTCVWFVIKAEMGPPVGNRKVTILTEDSSLIDGATSYVMENPYEFVQLLYRGGDWHVVAKSP
jgi:hypothetical protein